MIPSPKAMGGPLGRNNYLFMSHVDGESVADHYQQSFVGQGNTTPRNQFCRLSIDIDKDEDEAGGNNFYMNGLQSPGGLLTGGSDKQQ
jgi:hypothetical protein